LAEGVVGVLRVDTPIEEEVNLHGSKKKKIPPRRTVNDFDREGFSEQFRFHSPEDIIRLIEGLGFPPTVKIKGYKLHAQKIILTLGIKPAPPGHLFVPWGSPFYAPGSPFHAPGLLSCDPGASFCALGSTFCTPTKLNLYHISTTNFF
jgi:hypothetical protein